MNSRRGPHERASERPPHPADTHRWPRAVRLLFILSAAVLAILLVAVGVSALVDAAREVVS